ncbi:MAG: YajQ family cyclic di-GMP-binding protein [Acidimicrobiales bacterium]
MPTFDIVSEVDLQEVRNAVDQASREIANRFDFKNTGSTVELAGSELRLTSNAEERLKAAIQVVEEKLVKRKVSLKALEHGKVEEGSKGAVRQTITLKAGVDSDRAKKINGFLKGLGLKGLSSQTQGEQIRVSAKKRDDLQSAIAALKAEDFDLPLQFTNFRD